MFLLQNLCVVYLNCLIGIHDDRDKNTENNVDEKTGEEIEIQATEPPHDSVCFAHRCKSCEDIISVDETEETFRRCAQLSELQNKGKFDQVTPT